LATGNSNQGHALLDDLVSNLEHYDAIDKAEILNAKSWLNARTGRCSVIPIAEMWKRMETLPGAVADQLRQMGMLDYC
jgi:hypothetical protein